MNTCEVEILTPWPSVANTSSVHRSKSRRRSEPPSKTPWVGELAIAPLPDREAEPPGKCHGRRCDRSQKAASARMRRFSSVATYTVVVASDV